MDKTEQLNAVISGIINNDADATKAAFAPYIAAKTQEILGYAKQTVVEPAAAPVTEHVLMKQLREWVDNQVESPVRFDGDRVIVGGKQVGVVQTDMADFESGINFIEDGGKFSKEFNTLEELFEFLISKYTKDGAK